MHCSAPSVGIFMTHNVFSVCWPLARPARFDFGLQVRRLPLYI
jgi:hypothetical protein